MDYGNHTRQSAQLYKVRVDKSAYLRLLAAETRLLACRARDKWTGNTDI
jgi:hypothetical protein